jgi:hypothetical protein
MYLLFITLGLCLSYFIFYYLLFMFVSVSNEKFGKKTIYSLVGVFIASLIIYIIVFNISDLVLGNRLLHTFGGGFLGVLVCFLVVKDKKIDLTKLQFFVLSLLLVTFLGVLNEILECVLQNYFGIISADSINDTWFDLISNTVGLLLAGIFFVPFINSKK